MFHAKLKTFYGFNTAEIKRLFEAVNEWTAIWNTDEFKNQVLSFSHLNKRKEIERSFYFVSGEMPFSNSQVYEKIMRISQDGACNFNIIKEWSWRFWSRAVAFTNYSTQTSTIYSNYFKRASIGDLVNTLAHEVGCHNAGFEHSFYYTPARDAYSVPYAIGNITQNIFEKYGNNEAWHRIGDEEHERG